MTKFIIGVQHRNQQVQFIDNSFSKKWQAEKFIVQQIEIARTNGHSTTKMGREWVVFVKNSDLIETTMWVRKNV